MIFAPSLPGPTQLYGARYLSFNKLNEYAPIASPLTMSDGDWILFKGLSKPPSFPTAIQKSGLTFPSSTLYVSLSQTYVNLLISSSNMAPLGPNDSPYNFISSRSRTTLSIISIVVYICISASTFPVFLAGKTLNDSTETTGFSTSSMSVFPARLPYNTAPHTPVP